MPIEFSCPGCYLRYSVKEELAGKSAKCGKCGERMKIPLATPANAGAVEAKSRSASSSKRRAVAPSKASAVPSKPPVLDDPASDISSWLDAELTASAVEKKQRESSAKSSAADTSTCPSCNSPLAPGSVLCVRCGFDTRSGEQHSLSRGDSTEPGGKKKRRHSRIRSAATLLRGTIFSFLAAMLGAVIWAVLAYFTEREFGFIAWALGGLTGLGMALGHEDDDGTFAGIIAAFMSLVGIVAAKILIVVIFIAAVVAQIAASSVEFERELLVGALTQGKLEAKGIDPDSATDEEWEAAEAEARAETADLTSEQIAARYEALMEANENEIAEAGGAAGDAGPEPEGGGLADVPADADDAPDFLPLIGALFGPIDGIFILLAFFTAYKVATAR